MNLVILVLPQMVIDIMNLMKGQLYPYQIKKDIEELKIKIFNKAFENSEAFFIFV